MPVVLQAMLVVVATFLVVFVTGRIATRGLGGVVGGHLLAVGLRLVLATGIALIVGLGAKDHKAVLVFAVGAAYFAAVLAEGILGYRRAITGNGSESGRQTDGILPRKMGTKLG